MDDVAEQILELPDVGHLTFPALGMAIESLKSDYGQLKRFFDPRVLQFYEATGHADDADARMIAKHIYDKCAEGVMVHGNSNCYANDMFYIAHRFGLRDDEGGYGIRLLERRRSAIMVVWNGRHRYFEWITHNGFDNAQLFADMGFITGDQAVRYREIAQRQDSDLYCFMEKPVEERLVRGIGLTDAEISSAPLLCPVIWEKERTNNYGSGQYSGLHVRDGTNGPYVRTPIRRG